MLPTTASGPGHIGAILITASIVGNPTKPYDGNTTVALTPSNFSLSGLLGTDSFTVTQTIGHFNTKDVATANTVTASLSAGDFTAGAGTSAGNYILPISASGSGSITAVTVTASIVGDPTKPYDGNTNATLTSTNFSLSGLVGTEGFTVTKTHGTYNNKDVATAKTVTATLSAGDFTSDVGTLASNYVLPISASGAGHITTATVTASVVGNPTKPYDGNTDATLAPANFSLSGLATGESFTVTQTHGTYDSKDVAMATTVTATLTAAHFTAGAGIDANNYALPTTASGPGHIMALTVTASIIGDPTKPYDGNTDATLAPGNFSLSGLVGTENFTVTQTAGTYNSKNVVTATTVSANLSAGDFTPAIGTLASNYALPSSASGPGHITAVTVSASIVGNPTRPYNGTTDATLTPGNFSLSGLVGTEGFTVTQVHGTYNSKDVATANAVTASLSSGDFTSDAGTLASNYVLPISASGAGAITAATVTASIVGDPTKPYDGNTDATLAPANFSLSGLATGESFTVTQTHGTYNSKNVAMATTVTATLTAAHFTAGAGIDANNYALPTTASGPGHITALTVTASIIGDPTRPYNGNTNATLAPANFSLSGLVGTESFTVTQTAGTYNSKNVVTATTVSANLSAGDFTAAIGTLASNYVLPTTASGAGHITTLTVSVSIIGNPTKTYNCNTNATLTSANFSLTGVLTGESITVTKTTGTYNSQDVATANTVTTSLATGDFVAAMSTLLTNYTLPTTASGAGHITKANTATSAISSANPSIIGQTVTFTATVAGNPVVSCKPTGTVTFKDGSTTLGTGTLNSSGQATFPTSTLSAGNHSITVVYGADSNFNGSTSTVLTQSVNYTFIGFLPPIDNLPILNTSKAGQTIPVKWQLKDYNGNLISDLGTLAPNGLGSQPIACDLMIRSTTSKSCLHQARLCSDATARSSSTTGRRRSRGPDTCRQLQVTLADGHTYVANFKFK